MTFDGDRKFDANMARLLQLWGNRQKDSALAHNENLPKIKQALETVVYDSEDETKKDEDTIDTSTLILPHTAQYYGAKFSELIDVLYQEPTASGAILLTSPAISQFMINLTDHVTVVPFEAGLLVETMLRQQSIHKYKMTAARSRKYREGFPWVALSEGSPINIRRLNAHDQRRLADEIQHGKKTLGSDNVVEDYDGNLLEITLNDVDENSALPYHVLRRFKPGTDQSRATNWEYLETRIKGDLKTPEAPRALALEYQISFLDHLRSLRRTFLTETFASILAGERGYQW